MRSIDCKEYAKWNLERAKLSTSIKTMIEMALDGFENLSWFERNIQFRSVGIGLREAHASFVKLNDAYTSAFVHSCNLIDAGHTEFEIVEDAEIFECENYPIKLYIKYFGNINPTK